jgi:signal transduction histidine kinase
VPRVDAGETGVREDERRRLSRDLHDGPAQSLSAALFSVDLAITALDRSKSTARDDLLSARESVRDALDDLRALMAGLRPRLLEEQGLVSALQSLASAPALWGPRVAIVAPSIAAGERLPAEIEVALFRIAQEAVSNARRHSAASRVTVSLAREADSINLEVVDDGQGFAPDQPRPGLGRGQGLAGIRERVVQLQGELMLCSGEGTGTQLSVRLPLPAGDRGE